MIERRLYVGKKAIKTGTRSSSEACPIALTLLHHGFRQPHVRLRTASFKYHGKTYFGWLPPVAVQFIDTFDAGYSDSPSRLSPFSFTLKAKRWDSKHGK